MMIPRINKTFVISPHQWMIVGFAFIICIGALILALPIASSTGASIGFLDAFFTSTSAVCVTGLAVLDTGHDFTIFGQIVIMILIQVGGLGFMTFGVIVAIILGKKLGLKQRLLIQESTKSTTYYAIFHSISAFNNAGFALWYQGEKRSLFTAPL